MNCNCKWYSLQELVKIKYGKNQKKVQDNENGKYPIYGTGGLMGYSKEYLYNKPSVLIGRKGSISKVRYIEQPFWTVDTLFYTEVNENIVLPKYLYYKLSTINFDYYNEGTTIPSLRTDTLNKIELEIPNIEEQKKVITVLSSLDKKIELNNEMNKTLEEMAQALFKRWFVDFEFPNEEGKPYKSSGGEMVESEMGMIPKEWSIKKIKDIGEVVAGGTPSTKIEEYYDGEIPWITPKDLSGYDRKFISKGERSITSLGLEKSSAKLMKRGTVLFSSRAPIGYIVIAENEVTTNQGFKSIVCNEEIINNNYVYHYLKYNKEKIESVASGSTFKEVSGATMKMFDIIVPTINLLNKFKAILDSYDNILKSNYLENDSLVELRDSLLPKLMSGEIRVNDIEASL